MPLQNRVTPFGDIVAVPGRGSMMGNRGILHNAQRQIVRDWQVRRWIACRLEYRGRHRAVMQPGHYTELFFLDEAAALADGHRPCAECRNADYKVFQSIWQTVHAGTPATADGMDVVLQRERRTDAFAKRTHAAEVSSLPDGTYIAMEHRAWLLKDSALLAWSPAAYMERRKPPATGEVTVLTPPTIVDVFRAGYQVALHSSAVV